MSKGVNKVLLVGNLTNEPKQLAEKNGSLAIGFRIAIERRVRTKEGFKNVVDYPDCLYWNAQGVLPYLVKGKQVHIEGSIRTYQDEKLGRQLQEVSVEELTLLGTAAGESEETQPLAGYVEELQRRNAELLAENDSLKTMLAKQQTKPAAKKAAKKGSKK